MPCIWTVTGKSENYDDEQSQRNSWFSKIAPKDNWKLPIDCWIDASPSELYNCNEACKFFTGSELELVGLWQGKIHVKAPGYYATIGA